VWPEIQAWSLLWNPLRRIIFIGKCGLESKTVEDCLSLKMCSVLAECSLALTEDLWVLGNLATASFLPKIRVGINNDLHGNQNSGMTAP
jgi:hypothetical protein